MMIETYRGTVYPWQCDAMGHMNVQFYVSKFDEASWHLLASLGLSPDYFRESHRGMAALEQHIKYLRELRPGDLVIVQSRLMKTKSKTLQLFHRMINTQSKTIAAEMEVICVQIDLDTRKTTPFPDELFNKLVQAESDKRSS